MIIFFELFYMLRKMKPY